MKTVKASEFKSKCLQLMDEVAETGDSIIITKRGKPVSRLVPFRANPETLYGALKGSIAITGDIVAPIDTEWEALQ